MSSSHHATSSSSSDWVKFFTAAGIPSKYAAKYAVIFSDHRIQKDMLKDLNKEILSDMGIKTMGDVIAIMRHAKEVDEEESRRQVLGSRGASPALETNGKTATTISATGKQMKTSIPTSSGAGLSTSLVRRLGTTSSVAVKRTVVEVDGVSGDTGIKRRLIGAPTSAGERVVRLPTINTGSSATPSVFARLGGTASSSSSVNNVNAVQTLTSGSILRRTGSDFISLSSSSAAGRGKITATVKPTIKDRLGGGGTTSKVSFDVVSTNIKIKGDPPVVKVKVPVTSRLGSASSAKVSSSSSNILPLKKSIFDRLGS